MGWSIGYDSNWNRDIGYGVPSVCDHPGCQEEIHRGLAYVCGGEPRGGDEGCGLFFCYDHLYHDALGVVSAQRCIACCKGEEAFSPKPDTKEWIEYKLNDESSKE